MGAGNPAEDAGENDRNSTPPYKEGASAPSHSPRRLPPSSPHLPGYHGLERHTQRLIEMNGRETVKNYERKENLSIIHNHSPEQGQNIQLHEIASVKVSHSNH